MNPESICISLEYAKKLKELGYTQNSYFFFTICHDCTEQYGREEYSLQEGINHGENTSAYIADELLQFVDGFCFQMGKDDQGLWLFYSPEFGTDNSYTFRKGNLADLLAQMLIAKHKEDEINANS